MKEYIHKKTQKPPHLTSTFPELTNNAEKGRGTFFCYKKSQKEGFPADPRNNACRKQAVSFVTFRVTSLTPVTHEV